MKNKGKMSTKLTLIIAVSTLVVASNSWAAKRIQLEVVSSGGNDILSTNDNLCGPGEANGCIQMDQGRSDVIKYVLPGNFRCGDGGSWDISDVQLAMNDKAWGTPLPDYVADDFDVNLQTGFLNDLRKGAAVDVQNGNNRAYDIFYRVLATCTDPDGPGQIELDPKIRNTG